MNINTNRTYKRTSIALAGLAFIAGLLITAPQTPAYGREPLAPLVLTDTPEPPQPTATPAPPSTPVNPPAPTAPSDPGPTLRAPDVWVLLDGCLSCVSADGSIEYFVHVGNDGTMEAYNVVVHNVLGPGLVLEAIDMATGRLVQFADPRQFDFQIGTVNPGQVMTFRLRLRLIDPNAVTWSVLARVETSTPGDPIENNAHSLHGVRGGAWGPGPAPIAAVGAVGATAAPVATATPTGAKLLPKTGGEFRRPVVRRRKVNRTPPRRPVVVRRRK